jgi:hypothetical protein
MRELTIYRELANRIQARLNCINWVRKDDQENAVYRAGQHEKCIESLKDLLPSGSGIEGISIDLSNSTGEKIIIYSSFHSMNDGGYYDRWIDFSVTITPSLINGISLKISGRFGKYQEIREYLFDVFDDSLRETVKEYYCRNCEVVYYRKREELHSCPVCGNKLQ